jgi:hypothetical protein
MQSDRWRDLVVQGRFPRTVRWQSFRIIRSIRALLLVVVPRLVWKITYPAILEFFSFIEFRLNRKENFICSPNQPLSDVSSYGGRAFRVASLIHPDWAGHWNARRRWSSVDVHLNIGLFGGCSGILGNKRIKRYISVISI